MDLQTVAGISATAAASLFTWGGAGRIVSSLVTSFTFDRYSQVLQLGLAVLLLASGTCMLPWSHGYLLMALAMLVQGMGVGCLGCGECHNNNTNSNDDNEDVQDNDGDDDTNE